MNRIIGTDTSYISVGEHDSLKTDLNEILRLLTAIIKTSKNKTG